MGCRRSVHYVVVSRSSRLGTQRGQGIFCNREMEFSHQRKVSQTSSRESDEHERLGIGVFID